MVIFDNTIVYVAMGDIDTYPDIQVSGVLPFIEVALYVYRYNYVHVCNWLRPSTFSTESSQKPKKKKRM